MNLDQVLQETTDLRHRGRPVEPARHRLRYGLALMTSSWTAHYLDGRTAARHRVTLTITPNALQLLFSDGKPNSGHTTTFVKPKAPITANRFVWNVGPSRPRHLSFPRPHC